MIRIAERLTTPARDGTILTLSFEDRQRRRQRVTLDTGEAAALDLPRGRGLRDGDLLRAEDGRVIAVRAAAEAVSTVRTDDPTLLARAAYQLGNRHVVLEIGAGSLALSRRPCPRRHGRVARLARRAGTAAVRARVGRLCRAPSRGAP